jgi:hypothetical protein
MDVQYRRPDGTFVAIVNGLPYHVTPDDPLFEAAQEAGADAPFEPMPVAPPPPPAIPDEVSRFQARAALIIYGDQIGRPNLLAEADAILAGIQPGQFGLSMLQIEVAREAWAGAQVIRRDSPTLNLLFPALGLTIPEERDAIFVIAAGIVA